MTWLPAPGDLAVRVAVPAARGGLDPADPWLRIDGHGVSGLPAAGPPGQPHRGTGEAGAMDARSTEGKGWL
jgi:hypothetical protein